MTNTFSEANMYLLGFVDTAQYVQTLEYFIGEAKRYHEQNTPVLAAMYENHAKTVWKTMAQVDAYYGTNYTKTVKERLGVHG